jgi:hypothetical protein
VTGATAAPRVIANTPCQGVVSMQYTRLGNSGLVVSRLAFGAMTDRLAVDQTLSNACVAPQAE